MDKKDRRIFDRFEIDFSAELKRAGAEESATVQCRDISAAGVGLWTEERLISQTSLEIWLNIPDGHAPFRGLARVVWSERLQEDKWRAGIEFKTVDFMGIRRIFTTLSTKRRSSQI